MQPIIIGAGRGSRLNALTDTQPKCYAPIGGRRILDWLLEAVAEAGMRDPVFIGGYQIDMIRQDYPRLTYRHNVDWPNNNILASLFYAEDDMRGGFVCSYADILYRGSVVKRALDHPGDMVLCVDTDWRSRYQDRSLHPEADAEKVLANGDRILKIHRDLTAEEASGEYIGVARFSPKGAELLRQHYHRLREHHAGRPWRGGVPFEKAYLIHLFQDMLESGAEMHMVTTDGEYMEIDTEEDFALANVRWPRYVMSTKDHYGTLFPTAVVGSMPRPAFVREIVMGERVLSPERQNQVMDDAVRYAVRLQEQAGLDIITDGEWRRASYIGVIAEMAHGFEVGKNPRDGRPWTVVTGEVTSKNANFIVAEAQFLKRFSRSQIKVTLPAPALLGERLWDPVVSAKAYPTRESFVEACVPILRREVELLRNAGVAMIQIDDPHLCLLVDENVRGTYDNPDAEADFSVSMNNAIVEGIEGVRFAVHLCRRAGARVRGEACHTGGYEPIIPYLNRLKVHHLTMEFTAPGAGDAAVFRSLREDFEIGLGCVSVQPGHIDGGVEEAMKHLPPERIVLNPDCGFAPGSAAKVDMDEVYEKMKQEVEAARRLREKYG